MWIGSMQNECARCVTTDLQGKKVWSHSAIILLFSPDNLHTNIRSLQRLH